MTHLAQPQNLAYFHPEVADKIENLLNEYKASTLEYGDSSIKDFVRKNTKTESEDPFYIVDLGAIVKQFHQWVSLLPRVEPFYAVKCNSSKPILQMIDALGGNFDCASQGEIDAVMSLGVDASRIIFANPCKQKSHINYAAKKGITMVTFDNEEELFKIKEHWPNAEVILRIITDDSKSICQFSTKFGARLEDCPRLISVAKKLNLNLKGVSFHVGSGCLSVESFVTAVENAKWVFDEAEKQGLQLSLLDIGGGFPGSDDVAVKFDEIAVALGPAIDRLFAPEVRVIAEPGRFFACSTHHLTCNVFAKRTILPHPDDDADTPAEPEFLYYMNDGVYGSFNCIFFDHVEVEVELLAPPQSNKRYLCSVFGPTCDALDCIAKRKYLPEIHIGDWLYFPNFGAYTVAAASAFNGFLTSKIHYVYTDYNLGTQRIC